MSASQLQSYLKRENALAELCGNSAQNLYMTVVNVLVLVVIIVFFSITSFSESCLIQLPPSSKSFNLILSLNNTNMLQALKFSDVVSIVVYI